MSVHRRVLDEGTWRRFERGLSFRERGRYIREGKIVPAYGMKPQMLVRNPDAPENPERPWTNGGWSPQIVGVN